MPCSRNENQIKYNREQKTTKILLLKKKEKCKKKTLERSFRSREIELSVRSAARDFTVLSCNSIMT